MKPDQIEIGDELLKLLSSKVDGQCTITGACNELARFFAERIPKDELEKPYQNSKSKWVNDVQFARLKLVEKGLILKTGNNKRGIWKLSKEGWAKLGKPININTHSNSILSNDPNSNSDNTSEKMEFIYPEVVEDEQGIYYEGAKKQIVVNAYERNIVARQKCLDHFGYSCSVCNIDFAKVYGEIGKNFIHVHHLKEISEIGDTYIVDPIADLKPVCPNCHSMLHRRNPCFTIDELTAMMTI